MEEHLLAQLKNCKVLVTGGAGFIGSNLCEFLLEHGAIVYCLDNLSTGKRENLSTSLESDNFHFIQGDICKLEDCMQATKEVNYVLHQAALGSVPRSIENPIRTNEVNVNGFLNMLVASNKNNIKHFVYAASSSTYGDSAVLPKVEDSIGKPLSPYAITKYVNELYADVFHKTYGIDCTGLRYFNVFGRRQDPKGAYAAVIPKFVVQFLNHESITINGNGSFSRDFTYIDNVIDMNIRAMLTQSSDARNKIYNVACGNRTDLLTLAQTIRDGLSTFDPKIIDVAITFGPQRKGDVAHSQASIDRAKNLLGYAPKYDLKKGLKASLQWYWDHLK